MNADPTSRQLGFHIGEYRFEVIKTQFPAYLAVNGQQQPAHTKIEIWVGKWYFVPSASKLTGGGIVACLVVMTIIVATLIRRRKLKPTT